LAVVAEAVGNPVKRVLVVRQAAAAVAAVREVAGKANGDAADEAYFGRRCW